MKPNLTAINLGAVAALMMAAPVLAQTATATATTDLNIRSGPGPHFEPIGVISGGDSTIVEGCLETGSWCQVNYDGTVGWSYSDYLVAEASSGTVVLTERSPELVGAVTYEGGVDTAVGAGAGAVAGALVGGPVGAAAGAALGAASSTVIPPEPAVIYVRENPVEQVYLEGEVVVGATVPESISLSTIPDQDYRYVYVNGQPVLVGPDTREIVYVVR